MVVRHTGSVIPKAVDVAQAFAHVPQHFILLEMEFLLLVDARE
jgi:hypothetical protein